jgi:flagellar protein FliO/FliZ
MQDRFSALLPILGAIVAFLIAALLVLYIIRLLFGRRIRSAAKKGSRRLDVVDVFDLDRERQLVIVRRDNTEHLLLIGGPNDLLVEGAISPAEALAARPAKEARPAPSPVAGWPAEPAPEPATASAGPKGGAPAGPLNLPPDLFAPAPKPEPTPAPPPAAAPPPPAPPSAAPPAPPPAAPPLRPAAPPAPPPARPAAPRAATPPFLARTQRVLQPKTEGGPVPPPPAPPASPRPAAPPPAPPAAAAPPPPPPGPPAAARPAAPPPAPAPAPAAPPPVDADPLESLEAEMARLLGRPDNE